MSTPMTEEEIGKIQDGDSLVINGIEAIFKVGVFYASGMPLHARCDTPLLADYHHNSSLWQQLAPLRKEWLVRDAARAKYGPLLPCRYTVLRGTSDASGKQAQISKRYEDIYGES